MVAGTALVVLAGYAAVPAGALADTGGATFEWTMPARYAGADGNGDGRVDAFEPDGPLEVVPDGYRVDFVASGAATCSPANSRTWRIEGVAVAAGDPNLSAGDPGSCVFSYRFPAEGTYEVGLEVESGDGDAVAAATRVVVVQDYLIVSLGDSVASGEGVPDRPGSPVLWQDEQCHRSASAGPARAARGVEAADPRTSVTFVHLACSGATVHEGLLGPYAGIVQLGLLDPQVDDLVELVEGREIDALMLSVGANDVKFSELVVRCFLRPACDLGGPGSAATRFAGLLPALPGGYDALSAALADRDVRDERVFVTEYFDPTRDAAAQPCEGGIPGSFGILSDHPAAAQAPVGITGAEAEWASNVMLATLNAEVASAASRHGWRFVGGIAGRFGPHGYCASDHWVVRWLESQADQGDENGALHPNHAGHGAYAARLVDGLTQDLYLGGGFERPRRPVQRLEVQGKRAADPGFADVVGPLDDGEVVTLRARVSGDDAVGRTLVYTLEGPGSLDAASGVTDAAGEATFTYRAPDPADDGRSRVVVTFADAGTTHRDTVGVTLDPAIDVSIAPTTGTLAPGQTQQFTATVTGADDPSVTWTAGGGTISPSGLYTAGTVPGTYTVTARSVEDPSRAASATVVVTGGSILGTYSGTLTYLDGLTAPKVANVVRFTTAFHGIPAGNFVLELDTMNRCWYDLGSSPTGGSFDSAPAWCGFGLFSEDGFPVRGAVGNGTLAFERYQPWDGAPFEFYSLIKVSG